LNWDATSAEGILKVCECLEERERIAPLNTEFAWRGGRSFYSFSFLRRRLIYKRTEEDEVEERGRGGEKEIIAR
jgi:hypothetical protein